MFSWGNKSKDPENDPTLAVNILKVKEQLEKQITILQKVGILGTLADGKTLGIVGIDKKEYAIPTLEQVTTRIKNKEELVNKKVTQGFTKIILVPFACSLESIVKKYETAIFTHHKNGNLFATKEGTSGVDEKLELNLEHPINVWNEDKDGDIKNTFMYFPQAYDKEKHLGKTKLEMLSSGENAWQIFILEDMPNIPKEKKGAIVDHRKQLETNKSPMDYLKTLQTNETYKGEDGLTPEADLMYAITHLEETNQVINDWQGKGSVAYELGTFIVSSNSVPSLSWNRDFNRTDLWKFNVDTVDAFTGARVGVRI